MRFIRKRLKGKLWYLVDSDNKTYGKGYALIKELYTVHSDLDHRNTTYLLVKNKPKGNCYIIDQTGKIRSGSLTYDEYIKPVRGSVKDHVILRRGDRYHLLSLKTSFITQASTLRQNVGIHQLTLRLFHTKYASFIFLLDDIFVGDSVAFLKMINHEYRWFSPTRYILLKELKKCLKSVGLKLTDIK